MVALQILLATIIGTILMTIFSYVVSQVEGKQFREPVLLNKLIDRWVDLSITPHSKNPAGWALHFFVGLLFVVVYHLIWTYTEIHATWYSAAIMGTISGLVGIGIWIVTFVIHPNPPKMHFLGFFAQLLFAHVLFGIGTWIGYMIPVWDL
ncbi:hypothetical protein BH09BAC1_BH09BAC1_06320 [soil metagenome]